MFQNPATAETTAAIRDIFATVLAMPAEQISLEADFYDNLSGDSLQKLEVVTRFEAAFSKYLTDEQAVECNTVAAFADLLTACHG
jgi:acyl carrier protein